MGGFEQVEKDDASQVASRPFHEAKDKWLAWEGIFLLGQTEMWHLCTLLAKWKNWFVAKLICNYSSKKAIMISILNPTDLSKS